MKANGNFGMAVVGEVEGCFGGGVDESFDDGGGGVNSCSIRVIAHKFSNRERWGV